MKSYTPLRLRKITSESPLSISFNSPRRNIELFTENFIKHHSKIDAVLAAQDNIRYLYNESTALKKLEKMVSLYETIETDLTTKGVDISVIGTITPQERNIIALIAEGMQTKKIASTLFISEHTVQTHRKNIYRKLNVTSITDLVKISMLLLGK